MQLIRENWATVITAPWPWPYKWNWFSHAELLLKKRKAQAGNKLSNLPPDSPCKQEKSHHHHNNKCLTSNVLFIQMWIMSWTCWGCGQWKGSLSNRCQPKCGGYWHLRIQALSCRYSADKRCHYTIRPWSDLPGFVLQAWCQQAVIIIIPIGLLERALPDIAVQVRY